MSFFDETESGYIGSEESDFYTGSAMRDVEILHVSKTNVMARGCRYGRLWFIKGLREELHDSTAHRRQLVKEFEVHSRLCHPSVVQAVGLEEIEGMGLCMVQEWIDGITLRDALRGGGLSANERRRLMLGFTEAVAYIHRNGVVHRDLKPSNVMIRNVGREIVIVDFGLADTADYVEWKQPAGTIGFISPEQMQSGHADPADDVYSLGVIMRELTPGYKAVADRCTGRLSQRPKDAGELLKILRVRSHRGRVTTAIIIAAVIILLAVIAVRRIVALENDSADAQRYIVALRDEMKSSAVLGANLRDSLTAVHAKLDVAEAKLTNITEHETLCRNVSDAGFRRIDAPLKHFDQIVFSHDGSVDNFSYTDSLIKLLATMKDITENYCAGLDHDQLSADDIEKIRMDMYNYQALKISAYQERWLQKLQAPD